MTVNAYNAMPVLNRQTCIDLSHLRIQADDGRTACLSSHTRKDTMKCALDSIDKIDMSWEVAAESGRNCFDEATERGRIGSAIANCLMTTQEASRNRLTAQNRIQGTSHKEETSFISGYGKKSDIDVAVRARRCRVRYGSCHFSCCQQAIFMPSNYWRCRRRLRC